MLLLIIFGLKCVLGDGQYECGDHGRFEYCIDEIPGCVIGCHCHPGYYFDTESKICEPNVKLTQNYRRYFHTNDATPEDTPPKPHEVTEPTPTLDPIDNQVDEITKNADDLGDWLYNQFFKTIENQVINKTKENATPTRRSESGPLTVKNINRKKMSRKKGKRSKHKKKKSSMRRKLLRITENDSIFDSTSEEARSDSSDSSSDDSDSTFEIEQNEDKHTDDKEHGHKKIVIINKKPKPPLPSFIFLPNMDTPFYPPIGLPPPPIMPMYPMVPIPPMPAFPCPEENGDTTTSTSTTTSTITTNLVNITEQSTTPPASTTQEPTIPPTDTGTTENPESEKIKRAGRYKKKNRSQRFKQRNIDRDPYIGPTNKNQLHGNREKLLQRLRQKIENSALMRTPIEREDNKDNSFLENDGFDDTLNNEIESSANRNPRPDNVDFKYISELIHRVDLNNSRNSIGNNPSDSIEVYRPSKRQKLKNQELNNPKETRRSDSDDSYYTNLGRQIASIIRSADAQNQQVNIEIEQTDQNSENHVFFNENSSKSFWERSVRSPIKFLNSNKNRYDYLKKSNELLFDIENKVSVMASTVPSLTLQEIENIVNVMDKAQRNIKNSKINLNQLRTSNKNLNFNLWPQEKQHTSLQNNLKNLQRTPVRSEKQTNDYKTSPKLHGVSMHNYQRFTAWLSTGKNNRTYNDKPFLADTRPFTKNITYPTNLQTQLTASEVKRQPDKPEVDQRSKTSMHPKMPLIERQAFYSMLPNYKYMERNKYFQDYSNVRGDDGLLFPMKPLHQLINKPIDQQSYFHHDINHFHYF